MFAYHLKLALKSMRKNPIMTGLMVAAIAVGIGVSMTTLTVHCLMSSNPIPSKSDVLFAVTMDSWNPLNHMFMERCTVLRNNGHRLASSWAAIR